MGGFLGETGIVEGSWGDPGGGPGVILVGGARVGEGPPLVKLVKAVDSVA